MRIFKGTFIIIATTFLGLSAPRAGDKHDMAPYEGSKEFQKIKGLAGHWEGTSAEGMDPKSEPGKITVDYRVTSGGSAVVETLFAGTPHEMVSVYHDEKGSLSMTHYCMMQNQPHMKLTKAGGSDITLAAGADGNVDPKSCHMHSVTLQTPAPDKLVQIWTSFDGGKMQKTSTFEFTRKG